MEVHSPSTFEEICQLEPQLEGLAKEIRNLRASSPHFCANRVWYGDFENRFDALVGWHAWNPALRSELAYNITFQHLYNLMPPCRDCTCLFKE